MIWEWVDSRNFDFSYSKGREGEINGDIENPSIDDDSKRICFEQKQQMNQVKDN